MAADRHHAYMSDYSHAPSDVTQWMGAVTGDYPEFSKVGVMVCDVLTSIVWLKYIVN